MLPGAAGGLIQASLRGAHGNYPLVPAALPPCLKGADPSCPAGGHSLWTHLQGLVFGGGGMAATAAMEQALYSRLANGNHIARYSKVDL